MPGIDILVVAGTEEHHQHIVGLDRPGSQILEDAAVVAGHDIAGAAFGATSAAIGTPR